MPKTVLVQILVHIANCHNAVQVEVVPKIVQVEVVPKTVQVEVVPKTVQTGVLTFESDVEHV